MSQPGGSNGQGDRLAEDIAVAKLPLAPVAHSAADTAATSAAAVLWPEAVTSVVRQIDQPSVQASTGLEHCLDPPQAPLAVRGALKFRTPVQLAAHAATPDVLQKPSQLPSLQPTGFVCFNLPPEAVGYVQRPSMQ